MAGMESFQQSGDKISLRSFRTRLMKSAICTCVDGAS
jgi:hypothetical protein